MSEIMVGPALVSVTGVLLLGHVSEKEVALIMLWAGMSVAIAVRGFWVICILFVVVTGLLGAPIP
jgi:hypothetical protein